VGVLSPIVLFSTTKIFRQKIFDSFRTVQILGVEWGNCSRAPLSGNDDIDINEVVFVKSQSCKVNEHLQAKPTLCGFKAGVDSWKEVLAKTTEQFAQVRRKWPDNLSC